MDTKGQVHCLTFVQGHSDLYFQTSAPKLLDRSEHLLSGTKVCSSDVGHMTKMASVPIYGLAFCSCVLRHNSFLRFFFFLHLCTFSHIICASFSYLIK